MKEIKFRAWHRDNKEFCNGSTASMFQWIAEGQPITLLQFTGRQDENGVDIYAGDTVHIVGYGDIVCEFPFIELYAFVREYEVAEDKGIGVVVGTVGNSKRFEVIEY